MEPFSTKCIMVKETNPRSCDMQCKSIGKISRYQWDRCDSSEPNIACRGQGLITQWMMPQKLSGTHEHNLSGHGNLSSLFFYYFLRSSQPRKWHNKNHITLLDIGGAVGLSTGATLRASCWAVAAELTFNSPASREHQFLCTISYFSSFLLLSLGLLLCSL